MAFYRGQWPVLTGFMLFQALSFTHTGLGTHATLSSPLSLALQIAAHPVRLNSMLQFPESLSQLTLLSLWHVIGTEHILQTSTPPSLHPLGHH